MSFPPSTMCGQTLAHERRTPPACGSVKPASPPPSACKVQAASLGGMPRGEGDGEQGNKLMGMGSQAAWALWHAVSSVPGQGNSRKHQKGGFWLLGADFSYWGQILAGGPAARKGALPGVVVGLLESEV